MSATFLHRVTSIRIFTALLLLTFVGLSSCQKNKTATNEPTKETIQPAPTDRLLSVANVYYTQDSSNAEAWFYETPLVFEFSTGSDRGRQNFEALQYARENKVPVNVRLLAHTENRIDLIIPATAAQIEKYKVEVSKRVPAEAVPPPDDPNAPSFGGTQTSSLISYVPNITVLNTIFSTIKSQCCKAPGVLIYGPRIPFQFVADGCYARAHKMRQLIENYFGYQSYKVFNFACDGSGTLSVKATLWGNNCCVKWWYHVASYVYVQTPSGTVAYLLDPAMYNAPVSISTWVAAQKNITCGYGGAAQGQVYYYSNAYAPGGIPSSSCTITPYADNTYTSANSTCINYAPKQGCSF